MADILHEVGIKASPSEVYKALATRDGAAGWWGSYLMSLKQLVETGKGAANPNDVSVTSWD